jgi:hypothetical protein
MIEQRIAKVNGIVDMLRQFTHPDNMRVHDLLEDLEIALCELETDAIRAEERLEELEGVLSRGKRVA